MYATQIKTRSVEEDLPYVGISKISYCLVLYIYLFIWGRAVGNYLCLLCRTLTIVERMTKPIVNICFVRLLAKTITRLHSPLDVFSWRQRTAVSAWTNPSPSWVDDLHVHHYSWVEKEASLSFVYEEWAKCLRGRVKIFLRFFYFVERIQCVLSKRVPETENPSSITPFVFC